jgi:hypothetical protein
MPAGEGVILPPHDLERNLKITCQPGELNMSVLVGKAAPEFKALAVMPDNSFQDVSLSDYKGKYVVLFF